jgi:hypothetical protein
MLIQFKIQVEGRYPFTTETLYLGLLHSLSSLLAEKRANLNMDAPFLAIACKDANRCDADIDMKR